MRRTTLLACLLILMAVPCGASGIGPMVAIVNPEDTTDDAGAGAKLSLDLGKNWNLEMRGSWFDTLRTTHQGRKFKLDAMVIDIGLTYDFLPEERVNPYLGAGGSYMVLDGDVEDPPRTEVAEQRVKDEYGLYYLAGVEYDLNATISIFGEVMYREIEAVFQASGLSEPAAIRFNRFKVDLAGLGANVGLMLHW